MLFQVPFNDEWPKAIHAAVSKWGRSLHTLFWKFRYTLLLTLTSHFSTYHALVDHFSNQSAAADDPETVCSELHLSLASTLVTRLSVVISRIIGLSFGRISGCLNSSLREECLRLPPTDSLPSFMIGSRWRRRLREGRCFPASSTFISMLNALCWTNYVTVSTALSRSVTATT